MASSKMLLLATALFVSSTLAKTDLSGCTYYDTVTTPPGTVKHYVPIATRIYYDPDTGEICELLDCGGGRAPPKTTVPGCAAYEGTETYEPRFIDPKTLGNAPQTVDDDTATGTGEPMTTEATASAEETESADTGTISMIPSLEGSVTAIGDPTTTPPSPTASDGSSDETSAASGEQASTPGPTSVSTAGGAMPTAGGMIAFAAGAAVYAGLM